MDARTAHATIRFGLGRRAGEPVPSDPVAWLAKQLDGPDPVLASPAPSVLDGLELLRLDRRDTGMTGAPPIRRVGAMFGAEMDAISNNLLNTAVPFRERLVWFWVNHFTVSLRFGGEIQATIPSYVREAIRPHVNGRFADMLAAVMHHPCMLMYLDNHVSVGPNSQIGKAQNRGLNENLARESLELHTATPAANYSQQDVIEYAKILTGWTFELPEHNRGFMFRPDGHEPGPKTVMGRGFPHGLAGGDAILAFLADHPMTHRNLATKLVRHFVADDPPAAAVQSIEAALRDTKGNLKAASLALIALPQAWQSLTKLRSSEDYVFAVLRALGMPSYPLSELNATLAALGEPLFGSPFPNGYPDTAAGWDSPEELMRRVDWVYRLAPQFDGTDPNALARDILGDLLSPETRDQVRQAGSRPDALTLLLTSPEFQRR
jgi:uncharacterized protein (DUF1800 family)